MSSRLAAICEKASLAEGSESASLGRIGNKGNLLAQRDYRLALIYLPAFGISRPISSRRIAGSCRRRRQGRPGKPGGRFGDRTKSCCRGRSGADKPHTQGDAR